MNKKLYALSILLSVFFITINYAKTPLFKEQVGPARVFFGTSNSGPVFIKHTYNVKHKDHQNGYTKRESFYYKIENNTVKKINKKEYLNKKYALEDTGIGTLVILKEEVPSLNLGKSSTLAMNFLQEELLPSCITKTGAVFTQCIRTRSSNIATELQNETNVINSLKSGIVRSGTAEKIKLATQFSRGN